MSNTKDILREVRQTAPRVIEVADDSAVYDHVTVDVPTIEYPWTTETVNEFRARMITLAAVALVAALPEHKRVISSEVLQEHADAFLATVAGNVADHHKDWDGVHRNSPTKWFEIIVEFLTAEGDRLEKLSLAATAAVEAVLAVDAMRVKEGRCFYEK
jgi:hypothetical protein